MITYSQAQSNQELHEILELQKRNLPARLTSEEKITEGFVTVQHELPLLQEMNTRCAHTLAKMGDTVVGYALSMHLDFKDELPVLVPMFKEIERSIELGLLPLKNKNSYIIMGQICIDKIYRKQGVFRSLYKHMLQNIQPEFTTIITEVDATNSRSLEAHSAIGFTLMSRYNSGGQDWELLYLQ